MGVLLTRPCLPLSSEALRTAGPLCSTGITPLPRCLGPILHPLAFHRLPESADCAVYLAPPISRRGEEGFPSRSMHPCHRATAITPPERSAEARGGRAVLPSPLSDRLGFRALLLRGYLCVHLRCGPVTCTIPRDGFVDGLQLIRFPSWLPSSYRASGSFPGGTVSHWTHQPSLVAPLG